MYQGLGWIDADVTRLVTDNHQLRIPHVGWNNIHCLHQHPLFTGLPSNPDFYFVHSYALQCHQPKQVIATVDYGQSVVAAVAIDNIVATQFHPEKSQDYGLKVIENFLIWQPV